MPVFKKFKEKKNREFKFENHFYTYKFTCTAHSLARVRSNESPEHRNIFFHKIKLNGVSFSSKHLKERKNLFIFIAQM